jgi:hypothetical protein
MISFNGLFSHSVIEQLGEAVKKHLQSDEAPKDRIKDVFSVFVEQAQNLKNYTTREDIDLPEDKSTRSGTLIIARNEDNYIVSSGNVVRNGDVQLLRDHLDPLISADKDSLKKMYKKRLREPLNENEGAGLGFISMARKATQPLHYSIQRYDATNSFFTIEVII